MFYHSTLLSREELLVMLKEVYGEQYKTDENAKK